MGGMKLCKLVVGSLMLTLCACDVFFWPATGGEDPPPPPPGLLETCAGSYVCTESGSPVRKPTSTTVDVHRAPDNGCDVGPLELLADGNVRGAENNTTWRGDSAGFAICNGANCTSCVQPHAQSHCSGVGTPCSQRPLDLCNAVSYCTRQRRNPRSLTDTSESCVGLPSACETYSNDEISCRNANCDWR